MSKINSNIALTDNFNLYLTPNYADVRSAVNIREGDGVLEESMSWKESCYIHAGLSGIPVIHIEGPDAQKFISGAINDVYNWPIHKCKHIVMCNEDGIICHHALTIETMRIV